MKKYTPYALVILLSVSLTVNAMLLWESSKEPVEQEKAETSKESGVLSYDFGTMPVKVSQKTGDFDYDAKKLYSMSSECGNNESLPYFENLVQKFEASESMLYHFEYMEESQNPKDLVVKILPNAAGYPNLESFQKDFNQCYAGGEAYPSMMNKDWLVFVSSCGTGVDDESGLPQGCQTIRDTLENTWELR